MTGSVVKLRLVGREATDDLSMRAWADRLWPGQPAHAAKWMRAVAMVRSTGRGWVLDRHARRASQ